MKDRPLCDRESDTHFFLATSLGITLMAAAAGALAEGPNPLDADAPVTSTTYKSPLADFRAFDPDESMQSWVDANRRVDEIGGWRTYLRQANPPKKPISKAPAQAKPASTKPVEPKMDAPKKQDTIAPASASGIPALAEGGTDQQDEIELSPPDLPERFSRGECPRVLTGLRLPVSPRVVELSKNTERLLARVTKCFKTRSYVVGGHTDGRGPIAANRTLSQSRADAVRSFLIAKGVDPKRITSRGFGETRPIDTNRTKRGRARNRRIDFTLDR